MTEKINKEVLIDLVRNQPALWNKRERIYNNRDIKPDLWERIGRTLNTTGKFAQKSWETLRDSYRKIRKKVQSEALIQGVKKEVSWPHYHAMCFLDEMLTPRESGSFSPKREPYAEERFSPGERDEDENSYARDLDDGSGEGKMSDGTDRRMQPQCQMRSKRKYTFEEEALELEKRKLQILESRQMMSSQKKIHEADDDYLFLMSLLPYMKKLDDVQKMRLRIDILNSVSRELENSRYQEVSASAWNQPSYAVPQRCSSSGSSSLSTTAPSPVNPQRESPGRIFCQGSSSFVNSTGT